jgi:hypothetical protein
MNREPTAGHSKNSADAMVESLHPAVEGHQVFIYLNSTKAVIVILLTRFTDDN